MTDLIIQTGSHQGKKINLAGQDCIIGRHESCQIRIPSADVSKQHCRLKHKQDGVFARDLGSRNGTFVNEEKITEEVLLKPGDTLQVGQMTFLIAESKSKKKENPRPETKQPSEEKNVAKPSKTSPTTSDDLIASWLSEAGDLSESSGDSTVVIKTAGGSESDEKAQAKVVPPKDDALKSVRERAKEIIRLHLKEQGSGH